MSDDALPSPPALPPPDERSLRGFLRSAREAEASDVHLAAGAVPFARVEGALRRWDEPPLAPAEAEALADEARGLGRAEEGRDLDFCIEFEGLGRFRANVHHRRGGWGLSLKLIPFQIRTLAELGLPEELYELTAFRVGLVLVTGPANCGKSSTLAALLERVNETWRDHIVTIEDPIEVVFESRGCNVTQREVGSHSRSFANALRAALREDPDAILVSEMRDLDTIRTAIVAAETGHLVMGTLHTIDAASTVSRILDVFPPKEQRQVRAMLAGSLRAVISQRLLSRLGGGRRVPAYEILRGTPAVQQMIREGRTHQIASALQTGRRLGMLDLDTRLTEMSAEGLISRETAREHAKNPLRFGGAA